MAKRTPRRRTTRRKANPSGIMIGKARQIWTWYSDERKQAKAKARTRSGWARCTVCNAEVPEGDTQTDHVDPVVAVGSESPKIIEGVGAFGWDTYLTRLWSSSSNLQILCSEHHKAKSKAEGVERRKIKNEKKAGG